VVYTEADAKLMVNAKRMTALLVEMVMMDALDGTAIKQDIEAVLTDAGVDLRAVLTAAGGCHEAH
jgi:hypothetical protein